MRSGFEKVLAALFCVMLVSASANGADGRRPMFSDVTLNLKFINSPKVKAGAVAMGSHGRLNLVNKRWGVVEIDYTPRYDYEKNSGKKSKDSGYWLEDVVCGIQVVVRDALGSTSRVPLGAALLSTKTEFWSIALDGKVHRQYMYIPPQIIERSMPARRGDGRSVKVAAVSDFAVCVTFFHKKWGVIGQGFYGIKGRKNNAEFRNLLKTVPTNSTFHGSILSRANSPWGVNDIDLYDLEKPAYIPAPLNEAAIEKAAIEAEETAAKPDAGSSAKRTGRKSKKTKK